MFRGHVSGHVSGAAFGDTLSGYDVVEAISVVETDSSDVPVVPVIIESATQVE
ncbi:MAG: peptidylprolyl isomerase [Proteobacteria bacterium]|jgi:cyclophilin family peptidyl-prolyl cis-trans isomerase|nr:peptidylprolyl isomerase [Pseudomonadota bacterium]